MWFFAILSGLFDQLKCSFRCGFKYFFHYRKSGAKVVYMSSNKADNHPLKCTLPITGHNNEVKYLQMNNFTSNVASLYNLLFNLDRYSI